MEIIQGGVYWSDQEEPEGSEPGYSRPFVVVQNNLFNQSNISTVIVCALTTNLKRAESPGNVLLRAGEGGLSKASVVNISQIFTVDKRSLRDFCGKLSTNKITQIVNGLDLILHPADIE